MPSKKTKTDCGCTGLKAKKCWACGKPLFKDAAVAFIHSAILGDEEKGDGLRAVHLDCRKLALERGKRLRNEKSVLGETA